MKSTISKNQSAPVPRGKRSAFVLVVSLLCVVVFAVPAIDLRSSVAFAAGVTESFNKGRKLFEQGKLRSAYKVLSAVVKKYPDHQPSQILLGRILFKAGKVNAAAKRFRKISSDAIAADFAYEYGIAMFSVKQCDRAQAGFARVPASSKLSTLANFYRGVCYVRGQDWQKASKYLSRAKGLPGNLEQSRRQALSQVQKQLRAERNGAIGSNNPYIFVPTPPPPVPYQSQIPEGPAPVPPDNKPAPPPPPPPTGFTNAFTPSYTYTETTKNNDFHGTGQQDSSERKNEIKFSIKSKYNASPRDFGAQPYLSLGLDISQLGIDTKGKKVTYIAYENDPGTIVEQDSGQTAATTSAAETKFSPEAGYPVTKDVDVAVGFLLKDRYAEMKADKKTSESGPNGFASYGGESFGLKLTGSKTEKVNDAGKVSKISTVFGGELSKSFESASAVATFSQEEHASGQALQLADKSTLPPELQLSRQVFTDFYGTIQNFGANFTKNWDTFSLTGGVSQKTLTPIQGFYAVGPTQILKIEVSGTKTYEFGGALTITGAQSTLSGHSEEVESPTLKDPDGKAYKVEAVADGSEQSLLLSFKLTPLSWLSGVFTYKYALVTYEVKDPALAKAFQQKVADLKTETAISFTVSKSF